MVLTYRYRIKDSTSGKHLQRMGWAVHTVWNFCNEVSMLAWRRDKKWLSTFELITLCAGASKELGLHSDTISEVCRIYATRRSFRRCFRLEWRSRKRSLGWIPFRARFLKIEADAIRYLKRRFRFWNSRPLGGEPLTGSFTQDAQGRWYVNIDCEVDTTGIPSGESDIGIDLGLINQLTCSDANEPCTRPNLTTQYGAALANCQRAHKTKRVHAIHAKIRQSRKDWAHKQTTQIVRRAKLIVVGNVSSTKLGKTPMAKSVFDAGWGQIRALLCYKSQRLGVEYREVNEAYSSVTCSVCFARTGPSGLSTLGVRVWQCPHCGSQHHRDLNASRVILRLGRETPQGKSLATANEGRQGTGPSSQNSLP